ncbi:MAG: DUF1801 domain-containing protein [Pirellulales bacterium]
MRADMQNAESPEAYLAGLDGWRLKLATTLRRAVSKAAPLDERLKWGHLVYFSNGPVCLIRAEAERVLFGFWRGQRLRDIEPRLKPGGKYEMATLELKEGDTIKPQVATKLVAAAVALNAEVGDPTKVAPNRKPPAAKKKRAATSPGKQPVKKKKARSAKHVVRHRDGSIWAQGQMLDGKPVGYWEWFRKDGTKLRSGAFDDAGRQTGEWTTYDKQGAVYKVTKLKPKSS